MDRVALALAAARSLARPVPIVKTTPDRRYVLGVAYPAHRVDGHGDYMAGAELERAAWGYLQKGRQVGLHHADGLSGAGDVVESYIYRGPDWPTADAAGGRQVVKSGDWLLGVIFSEQAWPLIKSGRVTGWSIDGLGRSRTVPRAMVERRP